MRACLKNECVLPGKQQDITDVPEDYVEATRGILFSVTAGAVMWALIIFLIGKLT